MIGIGVVVNDRRHVRVEATPNAPAHVDKGFRTRALS
jgi:hypothetical protein